MLGRYGGEEFIAILPGTDEEAAPHFAERVRRRWRSYVFRDGATEVRMTRQLRRGRPSPRRGSTPPRR